MTVFRELPRTNPYKLSHMHLGDRWVEQIPGGRWRAMTLLYKQSKAEPGDAERLGAMRGSGDPVRCLITNGTLAKLVLIGADTYFDVIIEQALADYSDEAQKREGLSNGLDEAAFHARLAREKAAYEKEAAAQRSACDLLDVEIVKLRPFLRVDLGGTAARLHLAALSENSRRGSPAPPRSATSEASGIADPGLRSQALAEIWEEWTICGKSWVAMAESGDARYVCRTCHRSAQSGYPYWQELDD